jgi:probable addiction module antidote protein
MVKITEWDLADVLKTEADINRYLKHLLEEQEYDLFLSALKEVARIRKVNKISSKVGVSRSTISRGLSGKTEPKFKTIMKFIESLGFTMDIKRKKATA